ncbi:MAG: isopentenyl-diphosphate Delta-isomerase [Weeksellaceae bacterium]|nr:isopentenyl-diphosphate Delta-isomerase [Weeksellaceae bacterium]
MEQHVVLVNEQDEILGTMEKQQAHVYGLLHRAFSVFLFNDQGQMLLQQRAEDKYHSPTQWTNACCSHPRLDETYLEAAHRRLQEELNLDTELTHLFSFKYKADVGQDLWEHELDHVFHGIYNDPIQGNPEEVMATRWISMQDLEAEIKEQPENFTPWFRIILDQYQKHLPA